MRGHPKGLEEMLLLPDWAAGEPLAHFSAPTAADLTSVFTHLFIHWNKISDPRKEYEQKAANSTGREAQLGRVQSGQHVYL